MANSAKSEIFSSIRTAKNNVLPALGSETQAKTLNSTRETSSNAQPKPTQLSSIFSLASPQPTKRGNTDDLIKRQGSPQFEIFLTLDPDCGSQTFQGYSASDVSLFLNQNIPCQQYEAGYTEFSFVCQQPGATLTQAKCDHGSERSQRCEVQPLVAVHHIHRTQNQRC